MEAQVIYAMYGFTCHQLAYRSWFLYGNQSFYPLRLAGIQNIVTYEEAIGNTSSDLVTARNFIGDAFIGYKTALCQRDIAINFGFILAGVGFALSRRKWKPIPILFWIVLGLFPLFLDGIFQWSEAIVPIMKTTLRWESTPLLRTATGSFFGFTTGLFIFPKLEEALRIAKINHNCKESQ
ncbi:MAG: DUF2085 domain-containing protein [Anaerolineaceae bacterium]